MTRSAQVDGLDPRARSVARAGRHEVGGVDEVVLLFLPPPAGPHPSVNRGHSLTAHLVGQYDEAEVAEIDGDGFAQPRGVPFPGSHERLYHLEAHPLEILHRSLGPPRDTAPVRPGQLGIAVAALTPELPERRPWWFE
ncbi:hypothetical protein [Methylobacterium fujisawaense]